MRFGVITVLFIIFLLSLATIASAVTIAPINSNKKIEPEVTPYWDMGEPGNDPTLKVNTLSSSGRNIDPPITEEKDNLQASSISDHKTAHAGIVSILRMYFYTIWRK
jgi:K+-transporting ATPase c subunit